LTNVAVAFSPCPTLSRTVCSGSFVCPTTRHPPSALQSTSTDSSSTPNIPPQVFSTGYSTHPALSTALLEATESALKSHPSPQNIDLAIVHASSLYEEPSKIIPTILQVIRRAGGHVKHVVGNTAGGVIGARYVDACHPVEAEAVPALSVTLASLPDVRVRTFYWDDVPEFDGGMTRGMDPDTWKRVMGMAPPSAGGSEGEDEEDPVFMIIPSPAFQNDLDDLLRGLQYAFPNGQTFGGIASTVSSLSRARIFAHSTVDGSSPPAVYGNGCVGVAFSGDVRVDTMIAQGAKPVGGVYRVVAAGASTPNSIADEGSRSTISAIVLDEAATAQEEEETDEEGEEEENDALESLDEKELKRAKMAQDYAKARIPKPPLAEANFLMRRLSDDDQAFMRRALLIGLERGNLNRTPNELARLAKGEGHRFTVRQVASAGMKDGSVTFPLGSVNVEVGARCRFFVRDAEFARKEVEALWTGYKKKELERTIMGGGEVNPPTGCFVYPTLDRGSKLFGKTGFESSVVSEFLPGISSISGFFANGVLGQLDGTIAGNMPSSNENMLHGSSSQYVIFRSKSKRPIYSPLQASIDAANAAAAKAEKEAAELELAAENEKRSRMSKNFAPENESAPRSSDGELIVRRREIHSGRSLSVSTVEWSVAEKMAKPTSALEGFMWEKETQVDRQRERISLALLMSQCKVAMADPTKPKPRDWIGPVKQAGADGKFVIIPECKRMDPSAGSLRKRYDIQKIVKQLIMSGAPAISVNSDGVLFGGSLEDITKAREASNAAAVAKSLESGDGAVSPPILASDLLLYPYQLYKLRMAGADAVNLVVGALENKDLLYLTKIAATINLQVLAVCSSEHQINMVTKLGPGSINALIVSNRELETFDFDSSGKQALSLLKSEALAAFRKKHGNDVPVLVEGRVGIIEDGGSSSGYIKALKEAGAFGAIVGGGVATINDDEVAESITNWMTV